MERWGTTRQWPDLERGGYRSFEENRDRDRVEFCDVLINGRHISKVTYWPPISRVSLVQRNEWQHDHASHDNDDMKDGGNIDNH